VCIEALSTTATVGFVISSAKRLKCSITTSESTLSLVIDANKSGVLIFRNPSTFNFFDLFAGILSVSPILLHA